MVLDRSICHHSFYVLFKGNLKASEILTVQVSESNTVAEVEDYYVSDKCPNTYPVPICIWKEPSRSYYSMSKWFSSIWHNLFKLRVDMSYLHVVWNKIQQFSYLHVVRYKNTYMVPFLPIKFIHKN